ncbi:hypothetical protein Mapa_001178 [Marchantia paleacea]|nr:hypothetical protein Mapa_001178 [Marchantia paleacea]
MCTTRIYLHHNLDSPRYYASSFINKHRSRKADQNNELQTISSNLIPSYLISVMPAA